MARSINLGFSLCFPFELTKVTKLLSESDKEYTKNYQVIFKKKKLHPTTVMSIQQLY